MSKQEGAVAELVTQLGRLPGIGRKSAERLAFHLLRVQEADALALAEAIRRVRQDVQYCSVCFNLCEGDLCTICADPSRDSTQLCIVEQPRDLMSLEHSQVFKGVYHVLLGRIAPLDGIGPDSTNYRSIGRSGCALGISPKSSWQPTRRSKVNGTALYISNMLSEFPVQITRLARGITAGSILEYANREMIADALTGRQKM